MFSINSFLSKAAVAAALLFPVQAAAQCVIAVSYTHLTLPTIA